MIEKHPLCVKHGLNVRDGMVSADEVEEILYDVKKKSEPPTDIVEIFYRLMIAMSYRERRGTSVRAVVVDRLSYQGIMLECRAKSNRPNIFVNTGPGNHVRICGIEVVTDEK